VRVLGGKRGSLAILGGYPFPTMHLQFRPVLIPLAFGIALSLALSCVAWRRRSLPAVRPYIWLMALVGYWCLASAGELASTDLTNALTWAKIQYPAITMVPLASLVFTIEYAGRASLLPRRRLLHLAIIPALTVIMVWTNDWHALHWAYVRVDETATWFTLQYGRGPWFWVHTAYSYLLLLASGAILAEVLWSSAGLQRSQAIVLVIALLAPWATNAIYVAGIGPWPYLDITPFGFLIVGTALLWALLRYRLLDIMPVAHATVVSAMADAMMVVDAQGRVLDVNPAAVRLLGLSQDAAVGASAGTVLSDAPGLQECLASGDEARRELEVHLAGECRRLDVSVSPLNGRHPGSTARVIIMRDVTAQRRTEQALQESERRHRTVFETAADLILLVDGQDRVVDCNDRIGDILGYRREEVLGRSVRDLVPPDEQDAASPLCVQVDREGTLHAHRCRLLHKDGTSVDVRVNSSAVYDAQHHLYTVHIVRDITEQLRLEAQYRQTQKMDAIGRLAGGIAHDFNNLLTIITGCADMMRESLPPDCDAAEDLEEILHAGRRASDLTAQLLAFSRPQPDVVRSLAVNDMLTGMGRMLRRIIGEGIRLELDLDPQAGCIMADQGRMEQVVVNLAVNARDAMPEGGVLRLATARAQGGEGSPPGAPQDAADLVCLVAQDTGVGMDPEVMERIFEPFFTTKPPGEGSGLGLTTVYGIVTGLGGQIRVDSIPGVGTTFRVYLPRVVEAPPQAEPDGAAVTSLEGGHEHILLVEDEPGVRRFVGNALRRLGYAVTEAADGATALTLCAERGEPYDLVLTDVVMPGMSGYELLERLTSAGRLREALCMTGYVDEEIEGRLSQHLVGPLLRKPFRSAELAQRVRTALDQ